MVLDAISSVARNAQVAQEASPEAQHEFADHLGGAGNLAPVSQNGINQTPPGGLVVNTLQAVNTVTDPAEEIAKLNSDGDRVVLSLTGEGKLQLPVPVGNVPVGVGVKGQYGYGITIEQAGETPNPGTNDEPPVYNVIFDKNLLGGGVIEPPIPGIDPAAELNLRTTGSVTMRFDTQADAVRAVNVLQRLALEESVRDTGAALSPAAGLSNPASNPLTDQENASPSRNFDPLADAIAPSSQDMAFLRNHVTSYTSAIGAQERGKIAVKFGNLGIEPRLDSNQTLTRTVELPQNGQPGRVTYTLSGDLQLSNKEKLTIGKQQFDQLEIGYVSQNIMEHGRLRGEVSMSWEFQAEAFESSLSGQPVPELSTIANGNPLGAPDGITASLHLDYQSQSLLDSSRTDLQRLSIEAAVVNPGANAAPALNAFLNGDLEAAFRGMGDDFSVRAINETVRRDGVNQQHEVGVEFADIVEGKASLIANIGLDDITSRREAAFSGTGIADRLWGPQQSAPPAPAGNPPATADQPAQFVVVPEDGLNVRDEPSFDGRRISAFQHGTFVEETGQRQIDGQGREWREVKGLDVNDSIVEGWVDSQYLAAHAEGAMTETGRIDPDLETQGYESHIVQLGDTMWNLARRDGVDFHEMVQLNQNHIINAGFIFPGDKIYIPGTGQPAAAVAEAPPAPAESEAIHTNPSENSGPGSPTPPSVTSGSASGNTQSGSAGSSQSEAANAAPVMNETRAAAPSDSSGFDAILKNYQAVDDPGGLVDWQPRGNIIRDIAGQVTGPERVTAAEARILDGMSEIELADMALIRQNADAAAERLFTSPADQRGNFADEIQFEAWANNDGHRDAFRHAYWNALLTNRFGAEFAETFATAHEGTPGNRADREAMDLYNNEAGRRIAGEHPGASAAELAGLIEDALQNGELIVIGSSGDLAWSNQVAYGEHGFADGAPTPGIIPTPVARNPDSGLSGLPR